MLYDPELCVSEKASMTMLDERKEEKNNGSDPKAIDRLHLFPLTAARSPGPAW
jgi:hypothetical protein